MYSIFSPKLTFKSCTCCPNLGGGGNLDKIQKNSSFFRENVPSILLTRGTWSIRLLLWVVGRRIRTHTVFFFSSHFKPSSTITNLFKVISQVLHVSGGEKNPRRATQNHPPRLFFFFSANFKLQVLSGSFGRLRLEHCSKDGWKKIHRCSQYTNEN